MNLFGGKADHPMADAREARRILEALPVFIVRALRALGQQLKWQHMRYGPIDAGVWSVTNRIYAAAEARGIAEARVEYLKIAMFSASSPDGLLPGEIELAERLVSELAADFALAAQPARELIYWTDLATAMAPARTVKPPAAGAGVRFFGPGAAAGKLQAT